MKRLVIGTTLWLMAVGAAWSQDLPAVCTAGTAAMEHAMGHGAPAMPMQQDGDAAHQALMAGWTR